MKILQNRAEQEPKHALLKPNRNPIINLNLISSKVIFLFVFVSCKYLLFGTGVKDLFVNRFYQLFQFLKHLWKMAVLYIAKLFC